MLSLGVKKEKTTNAVKKIGYNRLEIGVARIVIVHNAIHRC
jgi:hypothetical protein